MDVSRAARVDRLRPVLLELHKSMLDAQRIQYERLHGRIETSGEFLGLVLNHPEFEWIRALSALIARLDEWAEDMEGEGDGEFDNLVGGLRSLIRPEGANAEFTKKYWKMVEGEPAVTVAHVKAWRLVSAAP